MTENHYKTKMVIVMRTDLNMRKGKMVAQGAHAALAWMTSRLVKDKNNSNGRETYFTYLLTHEEEWLVDSFAKICVGVSSGADLIAVIEKADLASIETHPITDNGTTEFGGVPTLTCCAIGPDYVDRIDAITGGLKLL